MEWKFIAREEEYRGVPSMGMKPFFSLVLWYDTTTENLSFAFNEMVLGKEIVW